MAEAMHFHSVNKETKYTKQYLGEGQVAANTCTDTVTPDVKTYNMAFLLCTNIKLTCTITFHKKLFSQSHKP